MDAAIAAGLSELGAIFILREEQRTARKAYLYFFFFALLLTRVSKVHLNSSWLSTITPRTNRNLRAVDAWFSWQ